MQNIQQFAEISYEIIKILKNNNIDFYTIYFVEERNSKVYDLRLEGDEINSKSEDILKLIIRKK